MFLIKAVMSMLVNMDKKFLNLSIRKAVIGLSKISHND